MKHNCVYKRLGDICTIKSGYTPSNEDLYESGDYPYFKVAEMNLPGNEKYLTSSPSYVRGNVKTFPVNSIVFPKNGAAVSTNKKRILITDSVVDLNTAVMVVDSTISVPYIYNILLNIDFSQLVKRGAIPTLNINALKDIIIPVPDLKIQEQIVAELDKLNEMIATRKEQLKELDNLAQALFYDTFGDPITNPKEWITRTYGDLFNIVNGGTPSTKEKDYWENGTIPWIGSNMCNNSILYKTDGKFITEMGLNNSSAKILNSGTTIIAMVGATIGKTAMLTFPLTTNQNIAAISLKDNSLCTPVFVFYNSKFLYPLFKEIGGAKFTIASLSFIKKLPIIVPPLSLQQQFAKQVEEIEKQKEIVEASIAELQNLLDSRMDYWFN